MKIKNFFHKAEFSETEETREAKKGRRMRQAVSIVAVLAAIFALYYWAVPKSAPMGSSGVFSEAAVEEKTAEVIALLNQDDFDGLKRMATEKMKNAIDAGTIRDVRAKINEDWGAFRSFGKIYMAEMKKRGELLAVAQTAASYENTGVTYTISFDREMKLAGLYMK